MKSLLVIGVLMSMTACMKAQDGRDGSQGAQGNVGANGSSCSTVVRDGVSRVECSDGSSAPIVKGDKGDKGDSGDKGLTGQTGADGKSLLVGSSAPAPELGRDGESYFDKVSQSYYTKVSGQWEVAANLKGASGKDGSNGLNGKDGSNGLNGKDGSNGLNGSNGKDGSNGLNGSNGKDGSNGLDGSNGKDGSNGLDGKDGLSLLTSSTAPVSAKEGDTWFNTVSADVSKFVNGAWSVVKNIMGKNGNDGATGTAGKDGLNVFTGSSAPADTLGKDGDSYFNTATYDYSIKSLGHWSVSANLKGAAGHDGSNGSNGKDGSNGLNGKDGSNGSNGLNVLTGSASPADTLGKDGDSYFNTATYDYSIKSLGHWSVSANLKGAAGSNGLDGKDGLSLLTSSTAPVSAKEGDTWFNTVSADVSKFVNGAWSVVKNIMGKNGNDGATGATGATGISCKAVSTSSGNQIQCTDGTFFTVKDGTNGTNGSVGATGPIGPSGANGLNLLTGTGSPTASLGVNGDSYFDTQSQNYYVKSGGAWGSAVSLKGAPGTPADTTRLLPVIDSSVVSGSTVSVSAGAAVWTPPVKALAKTVLRTPFGELIGTLISPYAWQTPTGEIFALGANTSNSTSATMYVSSGAVGVGANGYETPSCVYTTSDCSGTCYVPDSGYGRGIKNSIVMRYTITPASSTYAPAPSTGQPLPQPPAVEILKYDGSGSVAIPSGTQKMINIDLTARIVYCSNNYSTYTRGYPYKPGSGLVVPMQSGVTISVE